MARALTADEQQRYPWASRISDFVPVGRWRKIALTCALSSAVVLVLGLGFIYVTDDNVGEGLQASDSVLGILVLAVVSVLLVFSFVVGLVTAVQALRHDARTPLVWSLASMVPFVIGAVVSLL